LAWLGLALGRAGAVALGLFAFVLALELIKQGARGVAPLLASLDVAGPAGAIGFGWLMACLVLSGSPVAAIALALLAASTLSSGECFGMIVGSRLGASFVVLVVGALDDLRARRREQRSAYVGVAALSVTALTYLPSLGLAYHGLESGWLSGLRIEGRQLGSIIGGVYGPITSFAGHALPNLLVFLAGIATLLAAFRLFDSALPQLEGGEPRLFRVGEVLYRPWFMFGLGLLVTSLTLSVSVSLSLLVPLAAKGYVRRENLSPYILGANITTFDDTLLAAALVGHPDAVRIVALLMAAVTAVSLPIVFVFPHAFARAVDRVARRATRNGRSLLAFAAALLLVPLALMAF
jgi:Na+/phosphate symporter